MKIPGAIRNLFRACLLCLCCGLITGPQITLQLSAWGWMIASYSQESSLEQAIRETFGGERPCELCKIIVDTEETKSKGFPTTPQSENRDIKLILGLAQAFRIPQFSAHSEHNSPYDGKALKTILRAPTPPPRALV